LTGFPLPLLRIVHLIAGVGSGRTHPAGIRRALIESLFKIVKGKKFQFILFDIRPHQCRQLVNPRFDLSFRKRPVQQFLQVLMIPLKVGRMGQKTAHQRPGFQRIRHRFVNVKVCDILLKKAHPKGPKGHIQIPGQDGKASVHFIKIIIVPHSNIVIQMNKHHGYRQKPQDLIDIKHLFNFLREGLIRTFVQDIEQAKQSGMIGVVFVGFQTNRFEQIAASKTGSARSGRPAESSRPSLPGSKGHSQSVGVRHSPVGTARCKGRRSWRKAAIGRRSKAVGVWRKAAIRRRTKSAGTTEGTFGRCFLTDLTGFPLKQLQQVA